MYSHLLCVRLTYANGFISTRLAKTEARYGCGTNGCGSSQSESIFPLQIATKVLTVCLDS